MRNFDLLIRKGVFLYEYIDCTEKLEKMCLPLRKSFYSLLTGDTVSENDYALATNMWQRFSIQTRYNDLYLKNDILLLADIFENFCDSFVASCDLSNVHRLDSALLYSIHYYILSELYMGRDIKTFTRHFWIAYRHQYDHVHCGIRGLSQYSNRYARANNKYM